MSNKIILRQPAKNHRRQPLLHSRTASTVGEVVGGTAAECVAVCCCCPLTLADFLLLTIYKIPVGLYRKMLRKRRRRRVIKEGLLQLEQKQRKCSCGCCEDVNGVPRIYPMCINDASDIKRLQYSSESDNDDDEDAIALEKEMWERFYSAGFWRSSSRRETTQTVVSGNFQLQLIQLPQTSSTQVVGV
ncbi:hypothetical protein L195_g045289 [Trifolium pratense]|uniref:Uncharacterized protein n=2 Tax=Trifolium pratense TaxID=57577 RepID=A0ACB0IJS6_TRIPR|nr:uncharacterized protein LOC123889174 [Trifolium pratense]PNX89172.1 hypothetical protein L195_g045289 [Trifolium pratense]CAJ2632202.1 unnamed protein product [Trifolium pratense]